MNHIIEGNYLPFKGKVGIVVSRFNDFITQRLLDGALDCLRRHGVAEEDIDVVRCPGAFEIPQVARKMVSNSTSYAAVICLGCVIRGETPHFEYVAGSVTTGVEKVALSSDIPVIFGVLTTNSLEQAIDRAGAKGGNKGWDAALSALEMINLFSKIRGRRK